MQMNLDNILVIVPVLNEEGTIATVVCSLKAQGLSKIRVVDNGSTDQSKPQASAAGAEVLDEPQSGYGQACWEASDKALGDILVFVDGDGAVDVKDIRFLLEGIAAAAINGDVLRAAVGRNRFRDAEAGEIFVADINAGDGHGFAGPILGNARDKAHPAFADAILIDVVFLDALEANANAALEHGGIVKRTARISRQSVGRRIGRHGSPLILLTQAHQRVGIGLSPR